jgi:hypothetical protein
MFSDVDFNTMVECGFAALFDSSRRSAADIKSPREGLDFKSQAHPMFEWVPHRDLVQSSSQPV